MFNKKKIKNAKEEFQRDFKEFIRDLLFEDTGSALGKAHRFIKPFLDSGLVDSFGFDVNKSGTTNTLIKYTDGDSIAYTLFDEQS